VRARGASEVVGRGDELAAVERLLKRAETSCAALVLAGDAGIGKTTLWNAARAIAEARGFRVLASRPARTELQLPLGGFGDLFGGVAAEALTPLPGPQRQALEVALLRAEPGAEAADLRALSVATVGLLRELAAERPLLLAVDDVQWLDESSTGILAFAARRLEGVRVGILLTLRGTDAALDPLELQPALPAVGHERQTLGPLSLAALHRLFLARLGRSFPRLVLIRIEEASGGNPFYALEIGRALVRRGAEVTPSEPLPVPETLAALTAERIALLPDRTGEALVLAAAAFEPSVETLVASGVADPASVLGPAIDDAIVEIARGEVRFAHPLLAQAVVASTDAASLRRVHRRLAAATGAEDARARHLGDAADGPDETAAEALERAAERARERGATLDAVALFERSSLLSPDPQRAAARAVLAGEGAFIDLADLRYADAILGRALERSPSGPARAEAMSLQALVWYFQGRQAEATRLCEDALDEAGDGVTRAKVLLRCAYLHGQVNMERSLTEVREAVTIVEHAPPPVPADLLGEALLDRANGLLQMAAGRRRDDIERGTRLHAASGRSWEWDRSDVILFELARHTDDLVTARARLYSQIERRANRGAEDPFWFVHAATINCWLGDWVTARVWAERAVETYAREGADMHPAFALRGLALVEALEGRVDEARGLASRGLALATDRGDIVVATLHRGILGLVALSEGDIEEADLQLREAAELDARLGAKHPLRSRIAGDVVEAAVGVGDTELAERFVAQLEHAARAAPTPWALCMAARTRGLFDAARGDLDAAAAALERAVVEHEQLPMPFERARTLLAKGRVHHRRKEKRLADESLRAALAVFEELGSPLWAAQARTELARIGLRRRGPGELNETERRVAELAAQGLSNQEIAQRAFLSVKTVEANLTRVYRKLGIRSRAGLARTLA
jgi:DNA-binding CsgD family transcriptional regulator/tetratricopeptide (TPR) repeat protein